MRLRAATASIAVGAAGLAAVLVAPIYIEVPTQLHSLGLGVSVLLMLVGSAAYALMHRHARRLVWPT
jgi:hypothetical protein